MTLLVEQLMCGFLRRARTGILQCVGAKNHSGVWDKDRLYRLAET